MEKQNKLNKLLIPFDDVQLVRISNTHMRENALSGHNMIFEKVLILSSLGIVRNKVQIALSRFQFDLNMI